MTRSWQGGESAFLTYQGTPHLFCSSLAKVIAGNQREGCGLEDLAVTGSQPDLELAALNKQPKSC